MTKRSQVNRRHVGCFGWLLLLASVFVFWTLVQASSKSQPLPLMSGPGVTVVIQTFRRNACLLQAVRHWRTCSLVKEIAVSWGDPQMAPPRFLEKCRICRVFLTENRLSARFTPQNFLTNALFSVDDDVVYACADLERLYSAWTLNQDDMAGFVVRHVPNCKGYQWNRHYFDHQFNMILATKGALLSKSYYELISSDDMAVVQARQYTDGLVNSDDLLMAFVFARARGSGKGWIAVQPSVIKDLECGGGLSTGALHVAKRIHTFETLVRVFGRCPFVSQNLSWT
jgi:hypothetical protein